MRGFDLDSRVASFASDEVASFAYQEKVWGGTKLKLSPKYLGYLRIKYTLDDLKKVRGDGSAGSPPRVLDAGCGGGGLSKAIKHYRDDLEVYGVDVSRKAILHAKKNSKGVKFVVGDLYRLPYEDNYFNAVIVEDVLEHLDKPFLALSEINRVLTKGGVFSAFIPLEGSVLSFHFWLEKLGWKSKKKLAGHIQKFKKKSLSLSLRDSGFDIERQRYSSHLLGQIVDVSFFTFLDWTGKKLEIGLEEDLKRKPIKRFLKDSIARITNLESQVLNFIPGAGVHIKAVKK